jgi:hypothetical protein
MTDNLKKLAKSRLLVRQIPSEMHVSSEVLPGLQLQILLFHISTERIRLVRSETLCLFR